MTDHLDSFDYVADRYDALPRPYAFTATTPDEWRRWRGRFRRRFRWRLGPFPRPVDPDPWIGEPVDCGEWTRAPIRYRSRPGMSVNGYLLVPRDHAGRGPAILCLHGHGRGVDAIVGLADEPYHADFALQCVRRGCVVLAIEQLGFGRRRDPRARSAGPEASSCCTAAGAALLLGETMAGWRAWDAMRAIDFLRGRPEVDPRRIAVMGISGGGMTALFTAALDRRVRAAVVSGYLNSFRASICAIDHCIDNYVPGMLLDAEMSDIAALIAPRAAFFEAGTLDGIFPIEAARAAYAEARRAWDLAGAPDRVGFEEFEGDHRFHGVGAFRFLERVL